ncbi:unnamed protein product [Rangifer tarandus platyrhynchus]|uniref:Ripply transcriptional repressor 2 n=2 Tax=Rangifer tarandus platyrhynchus TaxID=3082113 RepID=A0ABN8ZI95_RANTA|nr:unnamed protein product [Rangifer tarandus platyrhynchus]CAI9708036.1 unnamed protein product [Rangifer tarandus platyrhynchus]
MKKLDLHNPIGTESRLYFKELLITQDIQRVLEQASFPGHLGVARVRPRGSGRCAFTRSLFVYSASRGERERACKDAAGPGGYIKLWVRARWVPGASLSMEIGERTESRSGQRAHLCRPPPAPDLAARHGGADSGCSALAPPRAYPAPALPPAPPRLLPSALPAPHPPLPGSAEVWSPGSRFASSLRALCSPPRRSAGFWRPWIEDGVEKGQEAPHHAVEAMPDGPGITDASGKLSQYRHPVRLFWPKSKCYDYLYQEAEALLKNFPIQATISFYEDSDSEDETEELICEN